METQKKHDKRFSFEFFPPKTSAGLEKLKGVSQTLAQYRPDFFSVTFGAGGTTRSRTLETVLDVREASGVNTAPHLSCAAESKERIGQMLRDYKSRGINRIVALRGDIPSDMDLSDVGKGGLMYANELVGFIREQTGDHFHLEVGCYTEFHPEAPDAESDLASFKRKVDAGADSAISQFFFNADSYFYFVDRCEKMGIDLPIIPGIMPLRNFHKIAKFAAGCGAEIPRWIRLQMEAYGDDEESIHKFADEVVTRLTERLLDSGAPGAHFYTLNKSEPTLAIWHDLNLGERR